VPIVDWLKQQKPQAGPWLRLSIALGWTNGLLMVGQAWLLATVVDAVVFNGQALPSQWPVLSLLLLLFLLRAALGWGTQYSAILAATRLKQSLRQQLFAHLRQLGPAWLVKQQSGALSNALIDGIEALEGYYANYLPATVFIALIPFTLLLFITPVDWLSAVILLLTAPLVPFFMILIGKGAERRNQRQWRQLARMSGYFLDLIQGFTTLKLFNASRREARMVEQVSDEYRQRTLSVLRIAFLSSFALEFFATVSIAVLAVVIGFRLYWGEMAFFSGFYVLLLAPEFYQPLRTLGSSYHDRMEAIGAAEQLQAIFAATPAANAVGVYPYRTDQPEGAALQLNSVDFSYPDGQQVLSNLSLKIAAGERIALVGRSGAGKSTLFSLLLGYLQPQRGELLVDGQPLSLLELQSWHRQIAWLPQSPHLFYASVADNIRLGLPDASQADLERAAQRARCLDLIRSLPDGFNTLIGTGGRRLSGGEQQRIALARAFIRDVRLVILDEPTANLDLQSERLVQQAVDELASGRTLIAIAHRLHTVQAADRILVLQQGRLVQSGDHRQLQRESGPYAGMLAAHTRGVA